MNGSFGIDWDVFFASAIESDTVAACLAPRAFGASTVSLSAGAHHYCEDWSFLSETGENLSDSFLASIDLSSSVLNGSVMRGANLSNASLFNTHLQSVIPARADLTEADLSFADLKGALSDERTLFPSGNDYAAGSRRLSGGVTRWDAGMFPVPEPTFGWGIGVWVIGLIGMRRGRERTESDGTTE